MPTAAPGGPPRPRRQGEPLLRSSSRTRSESSIRRERTTTSPTVAIATLPRYHSRCPRFGVHCPKYVVCGKLGCSRIPVAATTRANSIAKARERRAAVASGSRASRGAQAASPKPTPVPSVLNSTSPRLGSRPGITVWASSTSADSSAPTRIARAEREPGEPEPYAKGANRIRLTRASAVPRSPQRMQLVQLWASREKSGRSVAMSIAVVAAPRVAPAALVSRTARSPRSRRGVACAIHGHGLRPSVPSRHRRVICASPFPAIR